MTSDLLYEPLRVWIGAFNALCEFLCLLIATLGFGGACARLHHSKFPFANRKLVTIATMNIGLIPVCIWGIGIQVLPYFYNIQIPCKLVLWPPLLGALTQVALILDSWDLYVKGVRADTERGFRQYKQVVWIKNHRYLYGNPFFSFLLIFMLILAIVGGIVVPARHPEDFTGHLPHCDVKNFWHISTSMLAVVFSLIQAVQAFFIRRQHSDGLFLRKTLLGCSYYNMFICLFMTFLKFALSEEIWIKYDLFAVAMAVSHLISGSIYTGYPLYQSTKREHNPPTSPVNEAKKKKFKREVLLNQVQSPKFHLFCCEEHTQADLVFWKEVESFQRIGKKEEKIKRAKKIYTEHIPDVDFPDEIKHKLLQYEAYLDTMSEEYLDIIFERAQTYVLSKMCEQQYDRFMIRKFTMPTNLLHNGHNDLDNIEGNHGDERKTNGHHLPVEGSQHGPIQDRESALSNHHNDDQVGGQNEMEPSINPILSTSDLDSSEQELDFKKSRSHRNLKRTVGIITVVFSVLIIVCWAAFPQLFEVFN